MNKWNLVIDVAKCFNCNMCTLSCDDEYVGNSFPGYAAEKPKHGHRWIDIKQRERGAYPMVDVAYLPVMCNHCDDAPCIKAAKDGAVTKRPDGIVLIDPEKAKGQKALVEACPYGAIFWNEDEQVPQAWPFDAHLLDQGWTKTRGSQVCPTQAMRTLHVEDAKMERIAAAENLETLHPEFGTKPRVYYKNLDKFRSAFVGGTVAAMVDGRAECVEGVHVVLEKDSRTVAETQSDLFGDFKLDGLDENSGAYRLALSHDRFGSTSVEFELGESAYLGTITL